MAVIRDVVGQREDEFEQLAIESSRSLIHVLIRVASAREAEEAIARLPKAARAKVIGAVLNRVNVHRHSYYYAQYYRKAYPQAYVRGR